jgi:hypothetical protein
MIEDLREQLIQEAQEHETEEAPARDEPKRKVAGLEPWQRLVVAVLLFLDVAVCGCLGLVMLGRIRMPF